MPDRNERTDFERRTAVCRVELREDGDNPPEIVGEAAVFDKWANIGGFREKIAPAAFTDALKRSDVRALFNHDPNMLLGRQSAETLELKESAKALEYRVKLPDTSVARDVLENVRQGNIQGNSFSFTVEADEWDKLDTDEPTRVITAVGELFDVGPVTFPAYEATTVSARAKDQAKALSTPPESDPVVDDVAAQARKRRMDLARMG